jgi:adenylate cyclase
VDNFNKAIDYFKAAIKIEPDYALAYYYMASCYGTLSFFNYLPPEKCLPQMNQATQQFLKFADESAERHLALADMESDFAAATIELKKAIELNPNSADAHVSFATHMAFDGNYTEAIKHASIAHNLDPFSLINNYHVAVVYWMAGDYEKVLEYGRRLVELEPGFYGGHVIIGFGLEGLKRYKEAVPEIEMAVNQNYVSATLLRLGLIYGLIGEKAKAREVLVKMENLRSTQWVGNYDIGVVYMAMGEFDEAFQYFEKAIEKQEGLMVFLKYTIRNFTEFKQDPRTKKLLEKIGLPYQ